MAKSLFSTRHVTTDVLVIGGGLGGCSAAIRAAEQGAKVLVVEKSHVRRSGNAATGVDHTWCYLEEVHAPQGFTPRQLVEDHMKSMGPIQDEDVVLAIAENTTERIKELETWGFPFKTDGVYRFVDKIHRVPSSLHWAGRDQKVLFERQMRRAGVETLNRVMVFELLLQDGRVVGALGVGTREPIFYVFSAKCVVMASGGISRVYPAKTCMDFNRQRYPYGTGDGIAMGLRAGAEVVRMEFFNRWTGLDHLFKSGRGTWIGVIEDADGNPVTGGPKVKPTRAKIPPGAEQHWVITKAYQEGRGPIYMNCGEASDEDFDYMCWALNNEGNQMTLQLAAELGMDLHHNRIEYNSYDPEMTGGYRATPQGITNIPGLITGGGEVLGNIKRTVSPSAYVLGKFGGESAAAYAREHEHANLEKNSDFIAMHKDRLEQMRARTQGAQWWEASGACRDIMGYYGCEVKYEKLLMAGNEQLARVRRRAELTLMAGNQHDLTRCIESLNLMELAEASLHCSLERKETRTDVYDPFRRVDYDKENPDMRKFIVYKKVDGKPSLTWQQPNSLA